MYSRRNIDWWRKCKDYRDQWYESGNRWGVPTILIFHEDCPGMIAKVATILSEMHINIGSMKVDREEKGKKAYMID
ncbi:ACT domain-containing protein [Erysipelothrix piscisicarius]|uniref:ACT domain-containing protein n=1 Tax=Erysipelothrix piscisicarius TaxID=2485784 RepID=UPI002F9382A2